MLTERSEGFGEIVLSTQEEQKAMVLKLFNAMIRAPLFYDTIAEELNISLQEAVEACDSLEEKGLVGEAPEGFGG